MTTIGVGIIVHKEESIKQCIESFEKHVDQIVVVCQTDTPDKVRKLAKEASKKVEIHEFGDWQDDFAMKRNFCFSKLKAKWFLWVDADDIVYQPENLRKLINNAFSNVGAIWLPYHYAMDEFGNPTTIYERERLMRANFGWIWRGRIHETCEPLIPCQFVRDESVMTVHIHRHPESRSERNFKILHLMMKDDPEDRRLWLYMGHQNFANGEYFDSIHWYLKFATDTKPIPLEQYQALCYASKAMRLIHDKQAIDTALMAVEKFPNYRDGYNEVAQSYGMIGDLDKTIHWAKLADVKDPLITDPPALIFINPLDHSFNRVMLLSDCYMKKEMFPEAIKYAKDAFGVRPSLELRNHIMDLIQAQERKAVITGFETLAVNLQQSKEYSKIAKLKEVLPFWAKDSPFYKQFLGGSKKYTDQIKDNPDVQEINKSRVLVNLAHSLNPIKLLEEVDQKYKHVKVIAPRPCKETENYPWLNVMSQWDMEELLTQRKRHIKNIRSESTKIWAEYDTEDKQVKYLRMYLGPGLEHWNPDTIKQIGCGGSETAASMVCKELATRGWQPLLYAMDTQVWDGVIYRKYDEFNPQNSGCHLFISSRIPDLFKVDLQATQKWLWMHDIHCGARLKPEIVEQLDAIVVLSQWHAGHIRRVYPFLKDAIILDYDHMKLTYNDEWTATTFYENDKARRLPYIAIIGNGLDIKRFQIKAPQRYEHRFVWTSSPDRGLEQVLELWPKIRKIYKDAELKIFYGWEYFDSTLFIAGQRTLKYAKIRKLIQQEGVEWCGRIGQKKLAQELMKSSILLYPPPHDFRETYGIAFLEAQAAGLLVFYRENGALGETIGDRGIPIPLTASQDDIISILRNTLHNKTLCATLRKRGREFAMRHTWYSQTSKMLKLWSRLEAEHGQNFFRKGSSTQC